MKHIASVVPEAVLGQMSTNKAHEETETVAGMSVKHLKDVPAASAWLKTR